MMKQRMTEQEHEQLDCRRSAASLKARGWELTMSSRYSHIGQHQTLSKHAQITIIIPSQELFSAVHERCVSKSVHNPSQVIFTNTKHTQYQFGYYLVTNYHIGQ